MEASCLEGSTQDFPAKQVLLENGSGQIAGPHQEAFNALALQHKSPLKLF